MKTIKGNFVFNKEENREKINELKKFIEKIINLFKDSCWLFL